MGESVAEYRQLAKVLRERANRYTDACETPWLCLASSRMRGSRERPGRTADTRSFPVLMTPRLERVAPLRIGYMHCFGCSPAQAPATHTGAFVILVMSRACVGTGRCWPRCTFASCRCTRGTRIVASPSLANASITVTATMIQPAWFERLSALQACVRPPAQSSGVVCGRCPGAKGSCRALVEAASRSGARQQRPFDMKRTRTVPTDVAVRAPSAPHRALPLPPSIKVCATRRKADIRNALRLFQKALPDGGLPPAEHGA